MRTITKTLGSKAVRLLMSAVLVLGLMPALSVASSPGEAWADDGTVGVWNTGSETYDGSDFKVKGDPTPIHHSGREDPQDIHASSSRRPVQLEPRRLVWIGQGGGRCRDALSIGTVHSSPHAGQIVGERA